MTFVLATTTSVPLTDIQIIIATNLLQLQNGNATERSEAASILTKQLTDLQIETSKFNDVLNATYALSSVVTANPTPEQKVEIVNRIADFNAAGLNFTLSQPGLAAALIDPNFTNDPTNAEFMKLFREIRSELKALEADPTNVLEVLTTTLNKSYAKYLSMLNEASVKALALLSKYFKAFVQSHNYQAFCPKSRLIRTNMN